MKIASLILCLFTSIPAFAQIDTLNFTYDTPPIYKGGYAALGQFFSDHMEYPDSAQKDSIGGTVRLCFNIDTVGNIQFKNCVNEPIGYGLEEEAYRVLMLTDGNWTPAIKDGVQVVGSLSLPIRFQLNDETSDR